MNKNIVVTVSASNMRAWGRQALAEKWNQAILGTLIYYLVSIAPVLIIAAIFDELAVNISTNIYSFLVSGPLLLGYTIFLIAIFRKKETSPTEVFYGFERFGKSFCLYFMMNLFILLWMLLFIIPGFIAALRYAMVFYILADNPNIPVMDAIRESKRMMNGNKWKYFCLQLSFIGWFLLMTGFLLLLSLIPNSIAMTIGVVIVAGAFILYLVPYMTASCVGFYEVANGNLRPRSPELSEMQENQEEQKEEANAVETSAETDDDIKVEVNIRS